MDELSSLMASLEPEALAGHWYLFGSVERGDDDAFDIDLMILCRSDDDADSLRRMIDCDSLSLPLHLSLMTFVEAEEIDAIAAQEAVRVFPRAL